MNIRGFPSVQPKKASVQHQNPSVQHIPKFNTPISSTQKDHPFSAPKSVSSTQKSLSLTPKTLQFNTTLMRPQFNTKNPTVRHIRQFNTPISSKLRAVLKWGGVELKGVLNWGVCRNEGFLMLNWRMCWTEAFFVLNWRTLGAEKEWPFSVTKRLALLFSHSWS